MARTYGGVLGLVAFLACLARGLAHGDHASQTLGMACVFLAVFWAIGCLAGWIAGRTVEEAVRGNLEAELRAESETGSAGA